MRLKKNEDVKEDEIKKICASLKKIAIKNNIMIPMHPINPLLLTYLTLLLQPSQPSQTTAGAAAAAARAPLPHESQQWLDDTEYASTNLKNLNARILIDENNYDQICTCQVPPPSHAMKCYPQQVTITRKDPMPGILSPGRLVLDGQNLRLLISDPADLKMVKPEVNFLFFFYISQ